MRLVVAAVCAGLALGGAGAWAQAPHETSAQHPACSGKTVTMPAEYAGWSKQNAWAAASSVADLPEAAVPIGSSVKVALRSAGSVTLAAQPGKAPAPGGRAGLVRLRVATAGTYFVALSDAAWVDVVKDGKALASTGHGHGPDCSGMRKVVDFALSPGDYVIQVSGAKDASIGLMTGKR